MAALLCKDRYGTGNETGQPVVGMRGFGGMGNGGGFPCLKRAMGRRPPSITQAQMGAAAFQEARSRALAAHDLLVEAELDRARMSMLREWRALGPGQIGSGLEFCPR